MSEKNPINPEREKLLETKVVLDSGHCYGLRDKIEAIDHADLSEIESALISNLSNCFSDEGDFSISVRDLYGLLSPELDGQMSSNYSELSGDLAHLVSQQVRNHGSSVFRLTSIASTEFLYSKLSENPQNKERLDRSFQEKIELGQNGENFNQVMDSLTVALVVSNLISRDYLLGRNSPFYYDRGTDLARAAGELIGRTIDASRVLSETNNEISRPRDRDEENKPDISVFGESVKKLLRIHQDKINAFSKIEDDAKRVVQLN